MRQEYLSLQGRHIFNSNTAPPESGVSLTDQYLNLPLMPILGAPINIEAPERIQLAHGVVCSKPQGNGHGGGFPWREDWSVIRLSS